MGLPFSGSPKSMKVVGGDPGLIEVQPVRLDQISALWQQVKELRRRRLSSTIAPSFRKINRSDAVL
jgi:hypothetical protein